MKKGILVRLEQTVSRYKYGAKTYRGGVSEASCHRRACKVSVIVPVYHVGKYINRCIDSLLKQTLREIEIICICGRDDSAFNTLCDYAEADGRVHVIEKTNTGVSAARNAGIKAAKGHIWHL